MEPWRAELYHHGILGQKWGVRRTPEQLGHKPAKKRSGILGRIDAKNRDREVNRLWSDARDNMRLSKASHQRLIDRRNEVDNIANEMERTGRSEAKAAIKNPAFKRDLDKKLYEVLGDSCDDEYDFDSLCDDFSRKLIETKYSPKTMRLADKYDEARDSYFSEAKKVVEQMVRQNEHLIDFRKSRKYEIDGRKIISDIAWQNVPRVWDSYDTLGALYGNMDLPNVYSMAEYNRNHSA